MSQLASSGATELRVRSLDAISQLLTLQVLYVDAHKTLFMSMHCFYAFKCHLQKISFWSYSLSLQPEQQTEDLLALAESWFHLLSNQPMDMIRSISSQPFPELHCGALRIFTVSAHLFLKPIISSLCYYDLNSLFFFCLCKSIMTSTLFQ